MDDALFVRGRQRIGDGRGNREHVGGRHPALGDRGIERLSLDQLHGQEVDAGRLFDREDGDDVRVVDGGEGLGLAPEAVEAVAVGGHLARDHFEGDIAPQLRVGRAVDLTHAAGSQEGDDLKRTEARAGGKRHSRIAP